MQASDDASGVESDQAAYEEDQTASDSDQTASDRDQTASDEDQAASDGDQLASDEDQAASDQELAPGISEQVRGKIGARREHATQLRVGQAKARLDTAATRDITAEERARVTATRDQIADRGGTGALSLGIVRLLRLTW